MNERPIKYAILGDVHANLEALTAVLGDARDQGCTHHACVGDIVGYNANPRECLEIVRGLNMPCVKGNHDDYCSTWNPLEGLSPRACTATEWTRRQLAESDKQWLRELKPVRLVNCFSLVHATLDTPERWGYVFDRFAAAASFTYQSTAVCFFGHTHLPMAFVRDSRVRSVHFSRFTVEPGMKYFINVGSVGEPRDGSPLASYVIYNLPEHSLELRRISYDAGATESKLRAAGLPLRRTV